MKKTLYILAMMLMATPFVASAQDEEAAEESSAPLSISGSVDTYFRQNLTTGNNTTESPQAPGSSFANQGGFSIGMVNLILAKEGEKSGFVADLVYGQRGVDAVFNSTSTYPVNQLYAYWNVSDKLTLTIGNWNTFLGYEVISPTGNFNYSTSYMFSYGPFSHSGVKADIGLTDELSLMLAIMNPTDYTDFNPFNTIVYGLQLGYENDNGGAWLNVRYGDEDGNAKDSITGTMFGATAGSTFQVDLTTGWNLGENFYLGLNTTFLSTATGDSIVSLDPYEEKDASGDPSTFMGVALYPQYTISDALSLGLRFEYFAEGNGGAGAIGAYDKDGNASVIDVTLSANYKIGDLTFIPECIY